jgi:hypothetical protein
MTDYINGTYFLLELILMNFQQSVDDHIVTYLTTELAHANMCVQSDSEHLSDLQNKDGGMDDNDQSKAQIYEEMIQIDHNDIAEYELALTSPNTWILSQPNVCYILNNWNCTLLLNEDSTEYKMFKGKMRSFTMLVLDITEMWEPLENDKRLYPFLKFVDRRLVEYLPGMNDEIAERARLEKLRPGKMSRSRVTRSVMGAVYTIIGRMWDDFHNQPGEPFLQSRNMILDTLTRAVMSSLYASQSED